MSRQVRTSYSVPEVKIDQSLYKAIESERDQVRLSDTFFSVKFRNEFYRVQSLKLIPHFTNDEHINALAAAGFYYSGKTEEKKYCPKYWLNCAFCTFETSLTSLNIIQFDLSVIQNQHNNFQTVLCENKEHNISVKKLDEQFKIVAPTLSMFPMKAFSSVENSQVVKSSDYYDVNIRATLCLRCKVREYNIITFPCNCIILCNVCISDLPHNMCPQCNKAILAYTTIRLS